MKTLILTVVLTCFFYLFWAPPYFIWIISILGLGYSLAVSFSIKSISTPITEGDHPLIEDLCKKLNRDTKIESLLPEVYAINLLQALNLLFLQEKLLFLFLGIGSFILARELIDYLETTYITELKSILGYLETLEDE